MVIAILTAIAIIVFFILMVLNFPYYDFIELILCSVIYLSIIFFVWLLLGTIWLSIGRKIDERVVENKDILSIKDNSSITGSWSLFSGKIEEKDYYFYWINTDKGNIREKVEADSVYIVEKEIEQPYYEKYESICKTLDNVEIKCLWEEDYYIFYVPKNTIKYDYSLE